MPTRVTFRVKRGLSLSDDERRPIAKKQRTTNVPSIRIKSEIVTTVEEVTVKTGDIDGSTACDHGASEGALCEPSYDDDPQLSHSASTSSTTSKQFTSRVGSSDNTGICSSKGRVESDMESLSNQDSENLPMNNVFSELQRGEELEYEEVAQNSTAHKQAAIPLVLNANQKRKYSSWDERFQDLLDFKKVNGHTNVSQRSIPLGPWVSTQRTQFRLLKEGKDAIMTTVRREKLEGIGFVFVYHPKGPSWDVRFQELVDFKKINGHTNIPQCSGPLGRWVGDQRICLLKEGKDSILTIDRREKLESIGFQLKLRPPWDVRFQELVDFKKINGHTNVPTISGPLGTWVRNQRRQYRSLKEGKHSTLTIERSVKLESIGVSIKTNKNRELSID
eukprot:scaffold91055_cov49-Attheya_sp.AAC.3